MSPGVKRDGGLQVAGACQPSDGLHRTGFCTKNGNRATPPTPIQLIIVFILVAGALIYDCDVAWARVDTRTGETRLHRLEGQVHSGTFVKSYSRIELERPQFAPAPHELHHRLWGEVAGLLGRVRQGLGGDQQRQALDSLKTQQPDGKRWHQSQTLMSGQIETVPTNPQAVSSFFANESQRAAADSVRERVPVLSQLTAFNFNFDLGSGTSLPAQDSASVHHRVRYGLIVRDIQPDMGGVKRASTTTTPEEIAHAGRARVQWGIGPLDEHEERPIMLEPNEQPVQRSFGGLLIPSARFKGSARAESFNMSGQNRGQLPPWRFDLTQEDQLYKLTYRTQKNPQIGNVEHSLNVPLVGALSLGQRYSETFSQVETSASGVLVDRRLPQVILHYMHLEERYRAEVQTTVKGNRVGASARSKVLGITDRPDEATEAYSLTFSRDF
jgi:hypothetical protein